MPAEQNRGGEGGRREKGDRIERERKKVGLNGFFSKFCNDTLKSANMKVVGNFVSVQSSFDLRFEIYFKFSKTRI
jgi:hypothetical protein